MERNEKLEKARRKLQRYQRKKNNDSRSNISGDCISRTNSNSSMSSVLSSPHTNINIKSKSLKVKDDSKLSSGRNSITNLDKKATIAPPNNQLNAEQQAIQLLIEEKSDLTVEKDKLIYQLEKMKYENSQLEKKLNEVINASKEKEKKTVEHIEINTNPIIQDEPQSPFIIQNKELIDKVNYQASIIKKLSEENSKLSSKFEEKEINNDQIMPNLKEDLEEKSKKLEDVMLELSTNMNEIQQLKSKLENVNNQNANLTANNQELQKLLEQENAKTSEFYLNVMQYLQKEDIMKKIKSISSFTNNYNLCSYNDVFNLLKELLNMINSQEEKKLKSLNDEEEIKKEYNIEREKDQENYKKLQAKLEEEMKNVEKVEKILINVNEKCETLEELLAKERNVRAEKEEIILEQTEIIEEINEEVRHVDKVKINSNKLLKKLAKFLEYVIQQILIDDNSFDRESVLSSLQIVERKVGIEELGEVMVTITNTVSTIFTTLKEYQEIKKLKSQEFFDMKRSTSSIDKNKNKEDNLSFKQNSTANNSRKSSNDQESNLQSKKNSMSNQSPIRSDKNSKTSNPWNINNKSNTTPNMIEIDDDYFNDNDDGDSMYNSLYSGSNNSVNQNNDYNPTSKINTRNNSNAKSTKNTQELATIPSSPLPSPLPTTNTTTNHVGSDENLIKIKEANVLLREKLADQQLLRDKLLEEIEEIKQTTSHQTLELNKKYEEASTNLEKEKFKSSEYMNHLTTMQEELDRLMTENNNLNTRQQQLEADLEKMITKNLEMQKSMKSMRNDFGKDIESLKYANQVLAQKLSKEIHNNELLSHEVESLPDYILLYHKERKTLVEQNKKLLQQITLLSNGNPDIIKELNNNTPLLKEKDFLPIKMAEHSLAKSQKIETKIDENENRLNIDNNIKSTLTPSSILNDQNIIKTTPKLGEININTNENIIGGMIVNNNVKDFTSCRYCSSELIIL